MQIGSHDKDKSTAPLIEKWTTMALFWRILHAVKHIQSARCLIIDHLVLHPDFLLHERDLPQQHQFYLKKTPVKVFAEECKPDNQIFIVSNLPELIPVRVGIILPLQVDAENEYASQQPRNKLRSKGLRVVARGWQKSWIWEPMLCTDARRWFFFRCLLLGALVREAATQVRSLIEWVTWTVRMCMCTLVFEPAVLHRNMAYIISVLIHQIL